MELEALGTTLEAARAWAPSAAAVALASANVFAHWRRLRSEARAHPPPVRPLTGRRIDIAVPAHALSAVFRLAERRGIFTRVGLEVEVAPFDGPGDAIDAMLLGGVDLAIVGDLVVAHRAAIRSDFVVLATVGTSSFDRWMIARRDLTIPGDLRGKRIAVEVGTQTHYIALRWLKAAELTPNDVELVDLPLSRVPRALARGAVDACVVPRSFPGGPSEHFGFEVGEIPVLGGYRRSVCLVARSAFIEQAPTETESLLRQLAIAIAVKPGGPSSSQRAVPPDDRRNAVRNDELIADLDLDPAFVDRLEDATRFWATRTDPPRPPRLRRLVDESFFRRAMQKPAQMLPTDRESWRALPGAESSDESPASKP